MCHTAAIISGARIRPLRWRRQCRSVLNARQMNAWMYYRRRQRPAERVLRHAGPVRPAVRQHRRADGRLVPQGNQHRRRPQGPEDAHRRLCRQGHGEARRRAAADRRRRHLSGAGKGHDRRREWVGPYDDEKLGFYKVAQYYYYPGWWEGGPTLHTMVNLAKWNELPKSYQACPGLGLRGGQLRHDGELRPEEPGGARRLVAAGARAAAVQPGDPGGLLRRRQRDLLPKSSQQCRPSRRSTTARLAFRKDAYLWAQVAEYNFDTFMMLQQRAGKL